MSIKAGLKISLSGTVIEAVGLVLDILRHLNIGIATPEGLLTFNHFIIFIGFLINFTGVLVTFLSNKKVGRGEGA